MTHYLYDMNNIQHYVALGLIIMMFCLAGAVSFCKFPEASHLAYNHTISQFIK